MTIKTTCPNLPQIEIRFPFKGERWITRLGRDDTGQPIEIFLDGGHLHKIAAQLTSQLLQHGVSVRTIRAAVFGGPLAILLDRIIAIQPRATSKQTKKRDNRQ
jgi:hypothetical protein